MGLNCVSRLTINTMTPAVQPKTEFRQALRQTRVSISARHFCAFGFALASVILFRQPLLALGRLSFHDELASHVLLIPLLSIGLLYWERDRIFQAAQFSLALGLSLLFASAVLALRLRMFLAQLSANDQISATVALIVVVWI